MCLHLEVTELMYWIAPLRMVSHAGREVIWRRWWLYMNLMSVRAGKLRLQELGFVLQIAAVIG